MWKFSYSLCSIVLAIAVVGCGSIIQTGTTTTSQKAEKQTELFSSGVMITDNSLNLEQIAYMIFEDQLKYQEEIECPEERRIKDHKINSINIKEQRDVGFIFSVEFSILPATDKFILAGNGAIGDNGWIVNKFYFVNVAKGDKTYRIISVATGWG